MNKYGFFTVGLSLLSLAALPSCTVVGLATGAGASAGVAAAQEGGLKRAKDDLVIQTEINDLWFRYDVEMFTKLDMTVNQGRVLITGVVQNPEHRVEAVRLAWQPEGVKEVINEITVANSAGLVGYARDAWISGRLRTSLTFDRDVQSINYNIDTVRGVVYLMGIAQGQKELNRVIEIARTIKDVKQVVSYVKFVGEENALNADSGYRPPVANAGTLTTTPESYTSTPDSVQIWPGENQQVPVTEPYQPQGSGANSLRPEDRIDSEELLWDGGR